MKTAIETGMKGASELLLARVRARARLMTAWMEKLWSEGQTSHEQGLAITPGEVRRILTPPEIAAERYQRFVEEKEAGHLLAAVADADEALAENPFWNHLAETFALPSAERDLLGLLVAVELDPKLERVLAYLADDTRATRPTAAMATALFQQHGPAASAPQASLLSRLPLPHGRGSETSSQSRSSETSAQSDGSDQSRDREGALQPSLPHNTSMAALLRWRLAQPAAGEPAWRAGTAWQLDEAVLHSVLAETWVDPALDRMVRVVTPEDVRWLPSLYPEVLAELLALPTESQGPIEIALVGTDGSGRQTLAAQFAAAQNRPLVAALVTARVAAAAPDSLVRVVRLAHATGSVLYWRDAELAPPEWMEARDLAGFSLRGAAKAPTTATRRLMLPPLSLAARMDVWNYYSQAPAPAIVRIQRLTPAEIKLAAQAGPEAAIETAVRRLEPLQGDLLESLPLPYTWEDIVLPASLRATLEAFEAQVRLRWEVYEEWGFARLTHLGKGISALFGGASGTGKTMAAQVLARSLGLPLYRVDLAGVVNKYIGETEKRLRDVFDACERSGALLFFDEADALFGSRMQVKDSHDRFANIEIDYLLQRIEQFDGIAILATNRKNDLDSAFLRRLRFVVDFLNPGKSERLALWEKALPLHNPAGQRIVGEVNFAQLADEMELTGAQIKAIALGAAFLAKSEDTVIGMRQIELAAQREYAKQGLLLRAPFARAVLR